MKKAFLILLTGLILVSALVFTSCDPTFGLQQLSSDDVALSWVQGTWKVTTVTDTYSNNEKTASSTTTNTIDYSSTVGANILLLALKSAATSGNLYASADRTHVVYYINDVDDNGTGTKYTYTMDKQ